MITKFIEATNGPMNWGKFAILRFEREIEWRAHSSINAKWPLLAACGWTPEHLLVLDLQTGEGAMFKPRGLVSADLNKHKIWVCPLFEPFLTWLYKQDVSDLNKLPAHIDLPDAPFAMQGYRRGGNTE